MLPACPSGSVPAHGPWRPAERHTELATEIANGRLISEIFYQLLGYLSVSRPKLADIPTETAPSARCRRFPALAASSTWCTQACLRAQARWRGMDEGEFFEAPRVIGMPFQDGLTGSA